MPSKDYLIEDDPENWLPGWWACERCGLEWRPDEQPPVEKTCPECGGEVLEGRA
jgi:rubredoxin